MSQSGSRKKRVYNVRAQFGARTFEVKLRKFRTSSARRSKNVSQKVFAISLLSFREVAFSYKKHKRRTKNVDIGPAVRSAVLSLGIIFIGLGGAIYFSHQLSSQEPLAIQASTVSSQQALLPPTIEPATELIQASKPLTIAAKSIGLSAPIITVGLNDDKTLETPPLGQNVTGWYEYSPTPGEIGPSVVVGHVDSFEGPSVFARLHKLAPGDTITIKRSDKTTMTFTVKKLAQYNQSSFPTETVFGNTEESELRLITCGGAFDPTSGRYSHNTVVFASLVD